MPINDLTGPSLRPPMPDSHGHAAMLLVESLIHVLVERSIISIDDAIDIVSSADSVQIEVAEAADDAGEPMWRSHALLDAIVLSLKIDDGDSSTPLPPTH